MSSRILIVDDDPAVLSSLRRALSLEGYDVLLASDGEVALGIVHERPPDLLVLDVMMPNVDGYTICETVRRESRVPIIMLTARETVPDRIAGLDKGADDYLVKPFAEGELTARIRALLRRTQPEHADILSYDGLTLNVAAREAERDGRPLRLSPREYELLLFFMRHPRQALSREQICRHVWGYSFEGESNFVDVAVKELRKKLEGDAQRRLIQTVRGFGYALKDEQS